MKDQTDICELIHGWVRDNEEDLHEKVKHEIEPHLNQDGRTEIVYIGLCQILMGISEFHLAMVELEHVMTSSDEEHYIKSALVFNGFCLKKIGESYDSPESWEAAKGYYMLALDQLTRGLDGVIPTEIELAGMTYKADVHNKLGEYELALGTIFFVMQHPDYHSEATDDIKAKLGVLMLTARDGIDGRGKN